MMLKPLFALLAFFIFLENTQAQDEILLLNGKKYSGEFLSKSPDIVNFNFVKKSGAVKPFSFEHSRVYSITKNNEPESILYQQDTSIYHYYTPQEMRMYIYGENDAYNRFSIAKAWGTGFAIGLGVSMYDTYLNGNYICGVNEHKGGFFKREPSLIQFIVPFVVPIVAGAIKPRMNHKHASDPTFLTNEYYIEGFKKVRRFKRVKSSLFGSLCGVGVGMLTYLLVPKPC